MPRYKDAAYGGQSQVLKNPFIRLAMHRRITGWGWGELFVRRKNGSELFFGVLEHLAEVDIAGCAHARRLGAESCSIEKGKNEDKLIFNVALEKIEPRNSVPGIDDALSGTVVLSIAKDRPVIRYRMELTARRKLFIHSIKGPWLRLGADSFGTARHDAIFPGIDWVIGDEWSSGTDWFEHPQALRVTPHPFRVAVPVMAFSHDGIGLGLAWKPQAEHLSGSSYFRYPQPVFAVPNFVDRRNHHLLGLMIPGAHWGMSENQLRADKPFEAYTGTKFVLEAEFYTVTGTSLDVVVDWVRRHGMPDPGKPRYAWKEALDKIALSYNTRFWVPRRGWLTFDDNTTTRVPDFIDYYIQHGGNAETAAGLKKKADWCRKQKNNPEATGKKQKARQDGEKLLALQGPDGAFTFDPSGRHKLEFVDEAALWRPLGLPGEAALSFCTEGAAGLMETAKITGEKKYLNAARKALDYAMRYERPEGGDWWETPLHCPNLLAAGTAAIVYYCAYRQCAKKAYLNRAIRWMRALLPLTNLWSPMETNILYNTTSCIGTTSWFLSDWTVRHVQWQVLSIFNHARNMKIDWAEIDSEIDWNRYLEGVTGAVLRWMVDHKDSKWMASFEFGRFGICHDGMTEGHWDTAFADYYDPLHGTYGGTLILPIAIANNIVHILGKDTNPDIA